jgi:hypothetical protein
MSENNENEAQAPEPSESGPEVSTSETAEQSPPLANAGDVSYEEIVEISWERAEGIFRIRETMREMQQHISGFLLDSERRKAALLDRLATLENSLYESANELKQSSSVNPDWTYELKLPQQSEEKAYLIRKQE